MGDLQKDQKRLVLVLICINFSSDNKHSVLYRFFDHIPGNLNISVWSATP